MNPDDLEDEIEEKMCEHVARLKPALNEVDALQAELDAIGTQEQEAPVQEVTVQEAPVQETPAPAQKVIGTLITNPTPKQPQPGQTIAEIEAWANAKFPGGKPHEWERKYAWALYRSKPKRDENPAGEQDWFNSLHPDQTKVLEISHLQKKAEKDRKEREEFRVKYSLSDEEARAAWALRNLPPMNGEQKEWVRELDRLQKQRKRGPRKNADHSKLTLDESKALRKQQNRAAKQRQRATEKLEADQAHQTEEAAMQALPNFGVF